MRLLRIRADNGHPLPLDQPAQAAPREEERMERRMEGKGWRSEASARCRVEGPSRSGEQALLIRGAEQSDAARPQQRLRFIDTEGRVENVLDDVPEGDQIEVPLRKVRLFEGGGQHRNLCIALGRLRQRR